MSYRRQISYLELRKNGQRIQNAGYAKLESMEKEDILTVQLNGAEILNGNTVSLYLQRESGEAPLCEFTAERGRASCEKRIPGGKDRKPILGIRIPLEEHLEIVGHFAGSESTKKAAMEKSVRNTEEQKPEQNIKTKETVTTEKTEEPAQVPKETDKQTALHMKDTKWEQLSSIYPHIHPFRDTREFLSVGPEDFVILRERCYQMTHNSFLLHGYYNYRHLLLMRQDTSGQVKYYIGVPGNFYEREKQVARMFGFESFEGTREPAWEGDFGYYLIPVEL